MICLFFERVSELLGDIARRRYGDSKKVDSTNLNEMKAV